MDQGCHLDAGIPHETRRRWDHDVLGVEWHPSLAVHVRPQRPHLSSTHLAKVFPCGNSESQVAGDRCGEPVKIPIIGSNRGAWCLAPLDQAIDLRRQCTLLALRSKPQGHGEGNDDDGESGENHS
jgi:hypothetical protein